MAVRPTQRANGHNTARLRRLATNSKEKIKLMGKTTKVHAGRVISTTGAQELGGEDHAPLTTAPGLNRRFDHTWKRACTFKGQYSTVAAMRRNRVRKHLCQTQQQREWPKKPQGCAEPLSKGRGSATGKAHKLIRSCVLLIFLCGSFPLLSLLNFAHRAFTLHLQAVLCWLFNLILPCRTLLSPPLGSPSASPIEGPL